MKKVLGILKTLVVILLVIISVMSILVYTMLKTTENLISKENIIDTVKNVDIVELIGEDNKQKIYDTLEKAEIPTEYIDMMLENEEIKETLGEYVALSFEYVLFDKEVPAIEETEVTELLITSFDRVVEEAKNHDIEVDTYISKEKQEKVHEKIEYYVPEVMAQIPAVEEFIETQIEKNTNLIEAKRKIEKLNQLIGKIQMGYSYKNLLWIGIILPLILIIPIKYKKFQFIKWVSFPFLTVAVLLQLLHAFIPYLKDYYAVELSKINSIIEPSINTFLSSINEVSILCLIIGGGLIIIQIIISLYMRYRDKEKVVL